jgi:hypothetical protein
MTIHSRVSFSGAGATETMMTQAGASEVLKLRMVTLVTSIHSLDVADTNGHLATVGKREDRKEGKGADPM